MILCSLFLITYQYDQQYLVIFLNAKLPSYIYIYIYIGRLNT